MWKRVKGGFSALLPFAEIGVVTHRVPLDVRLKQVHGSDVVLFDGQEDYIGDGIISQKPGVRIGVKVADCYPVFLLNERAIGVLHAGWRGSAAGIVRRGVELFGDIGVGPHEILAVFGPGICGRCYEVGEDLKPHFGDFMLPKGNGKYLLDLYEYNSHLLRELGVKEIVPPPACTYEDGTLFSHRRGDSGRLTAFALLKHRERV